MAGWNGSGTYSRYHDWTTDESGAVNIDATRMDQEDDAIAAGINACLTKNGENSPSANLPMANFKHTGVGAGTALTHYADVASVQNSSYHYAASSGTDTYAVTLSPTPTAYAAGQAFRVKFGIANTGAATINVNTLGAKSLVKGASTALVANDLIASRIYTVVYDGTNFQVLELVNALAAVDINGGTIDGAVIGGAARAAVSCTTLDANGNVVLGDNSTDTLTVAPNAVTWSNNPTHSGNHTFSGNVTVTGTLAHAGDVVTRCHNTVNQTTTSATLTNATGLVFALVSGNYYHFKFVGRYETSATAGGIDVGLTTPTFDTRDYSAYVDIADQATATTNRAYGFLFASGNSVTSAATGAANAAYTFVVEGTIKPSGDGNLQLQFASENGAATITLHEGSCGFLTLLA